jgi:hypothetical protein
MDLPETAAKNLLTQIMLDFSERHKTSNTFLKVI